MEKLNQRIQRVRISKQLSIAAVAQKVGVSPSTFRDWEQGREIRGEPYEKIADALGVNIAFLLLGERALNEGILRDVEQMDILVKSLRLRIGASMK